MHHAGGTAKSHHLLAEIRQGQVHREQAELLVLHLLYLDAAMGQAPMQPIFEHLKGHGRGQGQRGFFRKEQAIAQVHRIEKGGCTGLVFPLPQVVAAVVHQHELPALHRRRTEATHYAIGRLTGHRPLVGALHKHGLVA